MINLESFHLVIFPNFQIRMYYNAKIHGINLSQLEVVVMYFNDSLSGSDYSSRTHFLTSEYQMDMKTEGWQRWEAVLPSHIQLRSVDHANL